jgi:hypothetical protein
LKWIGELELTFSFLVFAIFAALTLEGVENNERQVRILTAGRRASARSPPSPTQLCPLGLWDGGQLPVQVVDLFVVIQPWKIRTMTSRY